MALRIGLVGRGRWGRNIERALLSFPDVSVTAIEKEENPPAGIDGVIIATQSATHARAALPYIDAGIATFIEKPMATSVSDAERIQDAAKRSGAVVFVGNLYLYHPGFLAALEMLPSLGAIRYLLCEGMNDKPRTDSSVLWDWLPHDLSMARTIFGHDPGSVAAWKISGEQIAEAAVLRFEFRNIPVVSTISWLSPVRRKRTIIVCEKATLIFDDNVERRLMLIQKKNGEISYPEYSDELPLTRELQAFMRAVRLGSADVSHIETGIGIVKTIAAAEKSMAQEGQPVMI